MAGRRSIKEINEIRTPLGFPEKKKSVPVRKPKPAILAESKKAKSQAVLAKMLGSKGRDVVNKILSKALDDTDEDQMACLKLVADRIIPTSYFDLDKNKPKSSGVTIQILGVGDPVVVSAEADEEDDAIEGEVLDG